jgi:hypothetical protein
MHHITELRDCELTPKPEICVVFGNRMSGLLKKCSELRDEDRWSHAENLWTGQKLHICVEVFREYIQIMDIQI